MKKKPIFIIGIGRSGTTLLRLMLHNHPRIAIPYEAPYIIKYYENLENYSDLNEEKNLRRLVGDILEEPNIKMWDHNIETERIVNNIEQRTFSGIIDAIYLDYARGKGKNRWGDKSGINLDRIYLINEIFPEAQFIHLIRDGRDVARSVIKQPWGPNDIIQAADWWGKYVMVGRRMGAILGKDRYIEVKYENLVLDPENELKIICSFLGEEYSPEMLTYYNKSDQAIPESKRTQHYNYSAKPDVSRVYAWKRETYRYDALIFNRHSGGMLKELGYETLNFKVNKVILGMHMFRILLYRFIKWAP